MRPEYREASAFVKFWKLLIDVGRKLGVLPPLAHFGVPQIVIKTSASCACALRTKSSRSLKL